uniref:Interleukin-6 n=1 Tax=Gopherus evgoodei TaxID=1825980 RepID=A0A8C4YIH1_9SAUR
PDFIGTVPIFGAFSYVGTPHPHPDFSHLLSGVIKSLCVYFQMCEKFTVCDNSMEMLAQNNLNLPKITEEDGCLLSGFNEEKCLRGISSGLFAFQTYLEYVRETFISEKQKMKNPDAVIVPDPATQSTLFEKLKSNKKWIEKISTHLILRDFTSFMEKTVRAVRYLKNTRNLSV